MTAQPRWWVRRYAGWVSLALLAGCATPADHWPPTSRAALLAEDRAFSAHSATHGFADALATYLVEDAIRLPQDAPPVFGRPHIVATMTSSADAFVVSWQPEDGQVAASGDLGWTWGRYVATDRASGAPVARGKYLNIWQRQPDGRWRVKVDAGNQTPMPTPGGPDGAP
ncbi:YybH family protein [Abyssibacter profundi]|nr:nuclear transport factor 2 family protein [Abyssibacter profundi]